MAKVYVVLWYVCLAAAGGYGLFNGGFIGGDEKERNFGNKSFSGAAAVISAARREIGVREHTENSSKRIDLYCVYVGIKQAPWCAAFVSFCYGQAGYVRPKTAWSPALFPSGRLVKEAAPGLVMGIYFPSLGRIGHCGIVERLWGDFVYVIEGNTNVAGSREGDAVMRRIRHKRTISRYSNWLVQD